MSADAWIARVTLAPGVTAVAQTLAVMAALVRRDAQDEWLRRYALALVAGCRGHDFECEIERVFCYVRDAITYRRDPVTVERVQDAKRTIALGSGDCDDKVVLLATLLAAVGHRPRFVVIGYRRGAYQHVFLEVLMRGRYVALDPTNERATVGWEARGVTRAVYEIFR